MIVTVNLIGCDATTIFQMEVTPDERAFLDRVEKLANTTAHCAGGCEPEIEVIDGVSEKYK